MGRNHDAVTRGFLDARRLAIGPRAPLIRDGTVPCGS